MKRGSRGPDLFGVAAAAASGVMRPLSGDAALAVLFWGSPAEVEVIHHRGMSEDVRLSLSSAGGRYLAGAVRRSAVPLRVEAGALPPEAERLGLALAAADITTLALFPMFGERRTVGCLILPVAPDFDLERTDASSWVVACRALMALQLAAGTAAVRCLFPHGQPGRAPLFDGLVVVDSWERVLFADGMVLENPGWRDREPFGRSLDQLPGGALLWKVPPSPLDNLSWEEHLLPPSEHGGIPVKVAAVEADLVESRSGTVRVVLVRDLRSDRPSGRESANRIVALALRLAHATDELLTPLSQTPGIDAEPGLIPALIGQVRTVPDLVRALLEWLTPRQRRSRLDLNESLAGLVERIQAELELEKIRVFSFLDPELPAVAGDPLQVVRSLRVMVERARESLRASGGSLTVRTWQDGEWACAAVSDDGAGTVAMTPFVTSFEPLFEEPPDVVDEVLSQVRGVIEGMGGRFQMESRPRLWNRCTLMLPVGKREERAASVPAGETRVRRDAEGGLEVLVVDDNPALRSVLKRYLERRGHVVTEAVDGNHALDIVSAQEFDRLIVDVQMPGKSGPEFYVSLEGVAPRLRGRTFFMTGGALQEAAERFLEESGRPWIPKPFDLTQLARTLEAEV